MNAEVKKEWLKALRSDEYDRGFASLHKNDKFCCLGVLCDLASKQDEIEMFIVEDSEGEVTYNSHVAYLPKIVMEWAGLSEPNPRIKEGTYAGRTLASMNDMGYTFSEIADVIEGEL